MALWKSNKIKYNCTGNRDIYEDIKKLPWPEGSKAICIIDLQNIKDFMIHKNCLSFFISFVNFVVIVHIVYDYVLVEILFAMQLYIKCMHID